MIVGTWKGGADDGSGLRTMMYNFGITFYEDGTGQAFTWAKENGKVNESTDAIVWQVEGKSILALRYVEDADSLDWARVEIEITDFEDGYGGRYLKLTEKGKEIFWDFHEPLYKRPDREKTTNFWDRLLG